MQRTLIFAVLSLLLLPALAHAHGGAWRGPGGRSPTDPISGGSPGSGTTWVSTWLLNREQILNLRSVQTERIRERTKRSLPFLGGSEGEAPAEEEDSRPAWDAIIDGLMKATRDKNADVSTGSVIALGKAADPRAVPLLMKLAVDDKAHRTVNESAALALGLIGEGGSEVRTFLEKLAADPNQRNRTRAFATLGLGYFGDIGAIPALLTRARAKEKNRDVPACAILSLGLLDDEIVLADIERAMIGLPHRREKDDILRAHYAAALATLRARAGIPTLLKALGDKSHDVRRQAALTLGAVAGPDDAEVIKRLSAAVQSDKNHQTRAYAAFSLGEIGNPSVADLLLRTYQEGRLGVVQYAALGLAFLARNTEDEKVRERIIPFLRKEFFRAGNMNSRSALSACMGVVGDKEAVPKLLEALESGGDPGLRAHAAVALGLIGAESALPALRKVLSERANPGLQKEAAIALGLMGDVKAVDILLALVKGGSSQYVQGSAAVALGRLATPEVATVLLDMLNDRRNPEIVRAFSAVALGLVVDRRPHPAFSRIGDHLNHFIATEAVLEVFTLL